MTQTSPGANDHLPRAITGILIDPDGPGALIRVPNDHRSICTALNASNTEAYFLRNLPVIAWLSADGGEWNLVGRGFLQAVDHMAAIGTVSGPVLIVGEDEDGAVCDVSDDVIAAARIYGILAGD